MQRSILQRWAKPEAEIPVHEETIILNINGEEHEFELIHNFNMFNLDIDKAIEDWVKQTRKPTIDDFCHFAMSQAAGEIKLICFPRAKWIEFQIEQKLNS